MFIVSNHPIMRIACQFASVSDFSGTFTAGLKLSSLLCVRVTGTAPSLSVIFLDIDGVLHTADVPGGRASVNGNGLFLEQCMQRLQQIVLRSQAVTDSRARTSFHAQSENINDCSKLGG